MEKQAGRQAGNPGQGRIRQTKNNLCFWLLHSQVFYVFGELLKCAACLSVCVVCILYEGEEGESAGPGLHFACMQVKLCAGLHIKYTPAWFCRFFVLRCVCVCVSVGKLAKISTILQVNQAVNRAGTPCPGTPCSCLRIGFHFYGMCVCYEVDGTD